jgi:hypothetical protein
MDLYRLPEVAAIDKYACVVEWIHEDIEEYVNHSHKIDIILDSRFVPYALQKVPYKHARIASLWNTKENAAVYVVINGGHLEEIIDLTFDSYKAIQDYLLNLYGCGGKMLVINSPVNTKSLQLHSRGTGIDSVNFSYRNFSDLESATVLA